MVSYCGLQYKNPQSEIHNPNLVHDHLRRLTGPDITFTIVDLGPYADLVRNRIDFWTDEDDLAWEVCWLAVRFNGELHGLAGKIGRRSICRHKAFRLEPVDVDDPQRLLSG